MIMDGWDYGDKSRVGRRLDLLDIHQTAKVERLVSHLRSKGRLVDEITVWRDNPGAGIEDGTVGLSWLEPAPMRKILLWLTPECAVARVLAAKVPADGGPDEPYREDARLLAELRIV